MQIKEITDKNIWEQFLLRQEEKTFMQSWNWGEFHEKMGEKVWRLGIYDGGELRAVAQAAKTEAKRGTFLSIEHAPVAGKDKKAEVLKMLLEKLKEIGKQEKTSFIRMSPIWERSTENEGIFRKLGFRNAPMYGAAESSWKLDIAPAEDDLLAAMRKTTRYLIKQTIKNQSIEIVKSNKKEDIETFVSLNAEVGKRQQFVPFSDRYIQAEFNAFLPDDGVVLILGKYKGKVAAAAMVVFWSDIGFYHQAASLGEYAKYSVPYLVQWEAIREAKRRGYKVYDFWGFMDPKKYPNHPWAGPTLFKMGFGGKGYEYMKTQDYPLSWKYWPIAIFETIRAKRRGL